MGLTYSAASPSSAGSEEISPPAAQQLADDAELEALDTMAAALEDHASKILGFRQAIAVGPPSSPGSPVTPQLTSLSFWEWIQNQVTISCALLHSTIEHPPCQFWQFDKWGVSLFKEMLAQEEVWSAEQIKAKESKRK